MVVCDDLFGIANRLKEIDPSYEVRYNAKKGRFELYGGRKKELIIRLPFDKLDARTVEYVRKTRIERIKQILEEIERHNARTEAVAREEALKESGDQLREGLERQNAKRSNQIDY